MVEVERELFKLGVPVKTRHNEVAPGQFEVAPVFESANIATDHQQLVMITLKQRRRAPRHGLPAAREALRGRQRLGQARQLLVRQLDAGQPARSGRHAARERAVPGVLRRRHPRRAQVRRAPARGRRHRRQRSPPRRQRSAARDHLDLPRRAADRRVRADQGRRRQVVQERAARSRSASTRCRSCRSDAGDRNRTSPFAFTGNRFEFRAVGSGQSIAGPLVALNTAIAESLDDVATKLEAAVAGGKKLNAAIQDVLGEIIQQHGAVVFNGDGYSAEWHAEAEKRGLPNYKTTVDALPVLQQPATVALFDKYKVLSPRELHSRYEIYLEQYVKTVNVEAKLTDEDRQDDDPAGGAALPARAGRERHRA